MSLTLCFDFLEIDELDVRLSSWRTSSSKCLRAQVFSLDVVGVPSDAGYRSPRASFRFSILFTASATASTIKFFLACVVVSRITLRDGNASTFSPSSIRCLLRIPLSTDLSPTALCQFEVCWKA